MSVFCPPLYHKATAGFSSRVRQMTAPAASVAYWRVTCWYTEGQACVCSGYKLHSCWSVWLFHPPSSGLLLDVMRWDLAHETLLNSVSFTPVSLYNEVHLEACCLLQQSLTNRLSVVMFHFVLIDVSGSFESMVRLGLSDPHTSVTALRMRVYMFAWL